MTKSLHHPHPLEPDAPKVYCRQCHFFLDREKSMASRGLGPAGWFVCLHPHALVVEDAAFQRTQSRIAPEIRNAQNDCADFQPRQWWSALATNTLLGCGLLGLVTMTPPFFWGQQGWWGSALGLALGVWGLWKVRMLSKTLE